eukprot:765790-Hanusia_phi.AAC.10
MSMRKRMRMRMSGRNRMRMRMRMRMKMSGRKRMRMSVKESVTWSRSRSGRSRRHRRTPCPPEVYDPSGDLRMKRLTRPWACSSCPRADRGRSLVQTASSRQYNHPPAPCMLRFESARQLSSSWGHGTRTGDLHLNPMLESNPRRHHTVHILLDRRAAKSARSALDSGGRASDLSPTAGRRISQGKIPPKLMFTSLL